MSTKSNQPTIISSTEVKNNFGSILRRTNKDHEHFLIERGGIPVAVILSVSEYEALTEASDTPPQSQ